jgi:hypothetical protein
LAGAALDAVFHVGRGPTRDLQAIASQLEPSPIFEHQFMHALEDLGHVEIVRDERLQPTSWEASLPRLVGLPDTRDYLLIGSIGPAGIERVSAAVEAAGGAMSSEVDSLGLPRRVASDLEPGAAEAVCEEATRHGVPNLAVAVASARRLAMLLPPLSTVLAATGPVRCPPNRRVERFDVALGRWVPIDRVDEPGGYRLDGFGITYALRFAGDPPGSARIVDSRLVRYGAAQLAGEPLLDYEATAATLVAPLGGDLPGLYARAAVLSSGWLPGRSVDGRSIGYRSVPADIAGALAAKLGA